MKSKTLRIVIPLVVMAIIAAAWIVSQPVGTLSAIGWKDISLLCPMGALTALVAQKTAVPRVVIALVVAVVLILVFGRAFCAWICPTPIISKLRGMFSSKKVVEAKRKEEQAKLQRGRDPIALTDEELALLKKCTRGCGTLASKKNLDSRHIVLGASLLSAAIFGFPVFCLVCPIGLTFASIFLIYNLFAYADLTWTVIIIPALLLLEVVFFRKWCSHICPVSALMSLIAKGNRTFQPTIDNTKCAESSAGISCGVCHKVCPQGIDPRHPEIGNNFSECTKCRACVESCPSKAISMPLLPKKTTPIPLILSPKAAGAKQTTGTADQAE